MGIVFLGGVGGGLGGEHQETWKFYGSIPYKSMPKYAELFSCPHPNKVKPKWNKQFFFYKLICLLVYQNLQITIFIFSVNSTDAFHWLFDYEEQCQHMYCWGPIISHQKIGKQKIWLQQLNCTIL